MPFGDSFPRYGGPIWIDPHYYYRRQYQPMPSRWSETYTTDNTGPVAPQQPAPPTEDQIRKIVRQEIADLPIPFDVPDAPPEDDHV